MSDRDYLLGRLAEHEAAQLEEEILAEQETYERLRASEDDLVDEYASGGMSDEDRRDFERSPIAARDRVVFARAFARRARRTNVAPFPQRRVVLAAAAMIVVALATIFVMSRRPSSEDPVSTSQPVIPSVVEGSPDSVPDKQPGEASIAVITIALGQTRGEQNEAHTVTLAPNTTTLQLRVQIHPEDVYPHYSIELRQNDKIVWRDDRLTAKDHFVTADITATTLTGGKYEVIVQGGDEPLGFETLEVRR